MLTLSKKINASFHDRKPLLFGLPFRWSSPTFLLFSIHSLDRLYCWTPWSTFHWKEGMATAGCCGIHQFSSKKKERKKEVSHVSNKKHWNGETWLFTKSGEQSWMHLSVLKLIASSNLMIILHYMSFSPPEVPRPANILFLCSQLLITHRLLGLVLLHSLV